MTKGTASHSNLPAPPPYCPLPAPLPAVAVVSAPLSIHLATYHLDSAPWEADAALIMAA